MPQKKETSIEQELQIVSASRQRYRDLVDSLPVGIALLNPSFAILSANKFLASIFHQDVRNIVGKNFSTLTGIDREKLSPINTLTPKENFGISIKMPDEEGKDHCFDLIFTNSNTGDNTYSVFIQDVTDRVRLELENEEVLKNIPVGVFRATPSGRLTVLNPAGQYILRAKKPPKSIEECIGKEYWETVQKLLDKQGGRTRLLIEKKDPDGSHQVIEMGAVKTRCLDVERITGTLEDITGTIEMEHRLNSSLEQARAASKAKGRFLANMSHELRTPLNVVCGIGEILSDYVTNDEGRELLDDLVSAARHLSSLIGDVLDFSKIETGKMVLENKPFDLHELLKEFEGTFSAQAHLKGLYFHMNIDSEVQRAFRGDPLRIKQILYNLAGNAFKFVDHGGITVSVNQKEVPHEPDKRLLYISVADTGIGIPEDKLESIFHVFEQTAAGTNVGGTGLGLSISREFARLMGGDISVKSTLNKGTTFTVTLKLEVASHEEIAKVTENISAIDAGRALIVDDVRLNRKVLRLMLQKDGWTTTEAGSGHDAIAILSNDCSYDVIFMDISMPGMDGIECTKRIRMLPMCKHIPIIAVTAHALAGDRKRFIEAGMDGYVVKPVKLNHIRRELARLVHITPRQKAQNHDQPQTSEQLTPDAKCASTLPIDLAALISTCQGSQALAMELIDELVKESANWLRETEAAVRAKDADAIRKMCHLIRGTASTVSAHRIEAAAKRLGKMAREGQMDKVDQALSELKQAIEEIRIEPIALLLQQTLRPNPQEDTR